MSGIEPLRTLSVPPAPLATASAPVSSLKVGEVIGERLPECLAIASAIDIGVDDGGSGEVTQVRNAENVRHEEVRDCEVRSNEPFACPKHVLNLAQALPQPAGEAILPVAG